MSDHQFGGPGPIYFISDAHLGAAEGPPMRTSWLIEFLEGLPASIGGLFIVGDLFDFWFEYRHAIPKGHFRVLHALAEITSRGVPTLYFGGNHDFWVGSYLRDEIGMEVAEGPLVFTIQGRRLFVAHGDGLGRGDTGYKFLKAVLRNRLCIALYRSIHPDIGIPFAYRLSEISRGHTKPRAVIIPELVRGIALPQFAEGADIVVIGHVHEPSHLILKKGEFVIIGDWITNFTYAVLEEGKISLRAFHPGGAVSEIIAPEISAES